MCQDLRRLRRRTQPSAAATKLRQCADLQNTLCPLKGRVIRAVEDEIERFSRETASPVAVAEGDVRLRSDRKFRRLGVSDLRRLRRRTQPSAAATKLRQCADLQNTLCPLKGHFIQAVEDKLESFSPPVAWQALT